MSDPMIRSYRLVSRGGAGLCCDDLGVALGPLALNKVISGTMGRRYELRPWAHIAVALRSAYGGVSDETVDRYHRGLGKVCQMLDRGDAALARIYAVQMAFPDIEAAGMTKLAQSAEWLKFNPHWMDEFRNHGEFASTPGETGSGADGGNIQDIAHKVKPPSEDQKRFVDDHVDDFQRAAKELNVPIENVVALSAIDSSWGHLPFATIGNNYYGLHYPTAGAIGYMIAGDKSRKIYYSAREEDKFKTRVAVFASVSEATDAFVAKVKPYVSNIKDPGQFASAAQDSGLYAILANRQKSPKYKGDLTSIAQKMREYARARGAGK